MTFTTLLVLLACPGPEAEPQQWADVFVDEPGDPVPWLEGEMLERFWAGKEVLERPFTPVTGLGPTFNADSCAGCHQFPTAGGSAPRYRDFHLVQTVREFDGAKIDAGTNGSSPVLNIYATHELGGCVPPDPTIAHYSRRSAPNGVGMGLLHFVADETILANADPDDTDGDGISGKPNYEQGRVGRFGYKAQAAGLESFNRGAAFNQMGVTTDPLHYTFPESPPDPLAVEAQASLLQKLLLPVAYAQVAAPDEPTVDSDAAPDPEMSNDDQLNLLIYSTYMGVPRFAARGPEAQAGMAQFDELGCSDCHLPAMESTVGLLPVYSDLLLHDMGPELADSIGPGAATGAEWRTQPLWNVSLHGPFLHDGRADTLEDAIALHGGEAEASRDAWLALSEAEQAEVVAFLRSLGGWDPQGHIKLRDTQDLPETGSAGGPARALSDSEQALWLAGRSAFEGSFQAPDGLGTDFNADSCRACHQDPVLGGAGGIDTSVVRYGYWDDETGFHAGERNVVMRTTLPGNVPQLMPDDANVIELRQPPTLLGIGSIEAIPQSAIEANADPDDLDGDGISGKLRVLESGAVGRYGWKAQIPTIPDFVADAMLNELGVTSDPAISEFTAEDDDEIADPELPSDQFDAVSFYLLNLAAPARKESAGEPDVVAGESLFSQVGCESCHMVLAGTPLYSDLLLHDLGYAQSTVVDQEGAAVLPWEFKTAPLWGVSDTAPYLHDGRASTLSEAIGEHGGEAQATQDRFNALSAQEQAQILAFLESL